MPAPNSGCKDIGPRSATPYSQPDPLASKPIGADVVDTQNVSRTRNLAVLGIFSSSRSNSLAIDSAFELLTLDSGRQVASCAAQGAPMVSRAFLSAGYYQPGGMKERLPGRYSGPLRAAHGEPVARCLVPRRQSASGVPTRSTVIHSHHGLAVPPTPGSPSHEAAGRVASGAQMCREDLLGEWCEPRLAPGGPYRVVGTTNGGYIDIGRLFARRGVEARVVIVSKKADVDDPRDVGRTPFDFLSLKVEVCQAGYESFGRDLEVCEVGIKRPGGEEFASPGLAIRAPVGIKRLGGEEFASPGLAIRAPVGIKRLGSEEFASPGLAIRAPVGIKRPGGQDFASPGPAIRAPVGIKRPGGQDFASPGPAIRAQVRVMRLGGQDFASPSLTRRAQGGVMRLGGQDFASPGPHSTAPVDTDGKGGRQGDTTLRGLALCARRTGSNTGHQGRAANTPCTDIGLRSASTASPPGRRVCSPVGADIGDGEDVSGHSN